jgi:DNA end-binding protein Ku
LRQNVENWMNRVSARSRPAGAGLAKEAPMARAIWSGSLNFGLVTVPVELFSAIQDNTPHFHQLESGTADRVRIQRINERTKKTVAYNDIVKGYELDDGQYIIFTQDELDEIAPGRSKAIEISGFVDLDEVEPIFFATTYYLGPKGAEYGRVYALLREALATTNRAGVATFVMRGRQYLTAIKAEKQVLVLHTMHYADEIRNPVKEIDTLPGEITINSRELSAARQLIETLAVAWDPNEYKDEYRERLGELIEAKRHGEGLVGEKPPPAATNVVDLMDALERSIALGRRADPRVESDEAAAESEPEQQPAAQARKRARPAPKKERGQERGRARAEDLSALTKSELYARATELDIPGRSTMTRAQLEDAVSRASRPRRGRGSTVA